MDNPSPDKNSQVSFTQFYADLFATRRSRGRLFIWTFVIALVATLLAVFISDELDFSTLLVAVGVYIFFFPLMPLVSAAGPYILYGGPILFIILQSLWGVYLGIIGFGILTQNIRTSKILYFVFVILLLLNLGGTLYVENFLE